MLGQEDESTYLYSCRSCCPHANLVESPRVCYPLSVWCPPTDEPGKLGLHSANSFQPDSRRLNCRRDHICPGIRWYLVCCLCGVVSLHTCREQYVKVASLKPGQAFTRQIAMSSLPFQVTKVERSFYQNPWLPVVLAAPSDVEQLSSSRAGCDGGILVAPASVHNADEVQYCRVSDLWMRRSKCRMMVAPVNK